MCGIGGYLQPNLDESEAELILSRMGLALKHRGPDDDGIWVDQSVGLGLVHRRLEIVGLGKQGHQPMCSTSGRYVISYNGEIYNFRQLRKQLESLGYVFRGESDTEVLLSGVEAWGLKKTLKLCAGMFAFGLYDRKQRTLTLVRDRCGEKPLYYSWQEGVLIFASELAAILEHRGCVFDVDNNSLADLLRYNYIPEPKTIFKTIDKVKPGWLHTFRYEANQWKEIDSSPWWQITETLHTEIVPQGGRSADYADELDALLHQVVADQSQADVPIGCLLSGGIDSTTVTAILQNISNKPVRTFTVGFDDSDYDESEFATEVANHLGTDHTELRLSVDDVLNLVPEMPRIYDEPFADSSQIPTAAICKLSSEKVKVVVSGDGGDEVFGGYNRYLWGPRINGLRRLFPNLLLGFCKYTLLKLTPDQWDFLYRNFQESRRRQANIPQFGEKVHKLAAAIGASSEQELYREFVEAWKDKDVVRGGEAEDLLTRDDSPWNFGDSFQERMMLQDFVSYLPGDILVKVDRAAMSFGLEARIPFLDHRVVEFAQKLPIEERTGKKVLRSILQRYVPTKLLDRPKSGFALPIHDWLRGPLFEWADSLISEDRLREENYFDATFVRSMWDEHLSGVRNNQADLWSVLMFQAWQDHHC